MEPFSEEFARQLYQQAIEENPDSPAWSVLLDYLEEHHRPYLVVLFLVLTSANELPSVQAEVVIGRTVSSDLSSPKSPIQVEGLTSLYLANWSVASTGVFRMLTIKAISLDKTKDILDKRDDIITLILMGDQ